MLEFTAPKPLAPNGKGVSRDEETETRESEEKRTNKIMSGRLLYQHFSQIFLGLASDPNFSSVQRGTRPLPLHSSKPERRLLESHREGRQALRSPLISPFHPSFFSPLMNTSLLWWTGWLERGRGRGCLQWRTWLEAETGRGRREGWPVALTTISVAHRFVANRF